MQKKYISWDDVFEALKVIDIPENVVYGIPKGGMIAAGFLKHARVTHDPIFANVIFDDIIDSGRTIQKYQKEFPNASIHALIDQRYARQQNMETYWWVFPWEKDHPAGEDTVQQNITRVLQFIGEDPNREGLLDTPNRVVKSWGKIYEGYLKKPEDILTTFSADGYDEIVLLKDIEFFSTCEHHMIPFFGKAHIAYIPGAKIVGISKLARLLDIYSRRLQIQERIGDQITSDLMRLLQPKGAACIIEAQHLCMKARGVEKQNSVMVTSSMKGVFLTNPSAKEELMALIRSK
jgi:GTP cyclohydrolase I